jgi:hypothetical protein
MLSDSGERKSAGAETGAASFSCLVLNLGRARAGAGGRTIPTSCLTASLRSITCCDVPKADLVRVDKALLPADKDLGLARSGLDYSCPLQNRRHPHLLTIEQSREIGENYRLIFGGHPVKWDQALRLLLRHDTNDITS